MGQTQAQTKGQSPVAQNGAVAECALPQANSAKSGGQAVALIAGQPVSARDLDTAAQSQLMPLRNQEYQIRARVLDELIRRMRPGNP